MIKHLLFVFVLTIAFNSSSQDRTDIGIIYERGIRYELKVQMRIPIANKIKLNVGSSWEPNQRGLNRWRNYDYVMDQNDSILTRRYGTYRQQQLQIHTGLTLQLPWKYFSVSGDLVLGVDQGKSHNYSEYYKHNQSVSDYYELYTASHLDFQEARQNIYKVSPGFSTSFNFNLPLGNRFTLGLSATQTVTAAFIWSNSIESDPLNEFWEGWTGIDQLYGDFRVAASLRYSFGNEKTFHRLFKGSKEK